LIRNSTIVTTYTMKALRQAKLSAYWKNTVLPT